MPRNEYSVAVSNRSDEEIILTGVKIDNKIIYSGAHRIKPAGEKYSPFGFSSNRLKLAKPKEITLELETIRLDKRAAYSCAIDDHNDAGCLLKVSYRNHNITCACDSYADFY